jgi:hypothetical protein
MRHRGRFVGEHCDSSFGLAAQGYGPDGNGPSTCRPRTGTKASARYLVFTNAGALTQRTNSLAHGGRPLSGTAKYRRKTTEQATQSIEDVATQAGIRP